VAAPGTVSLDQDTSAAVALSATDPDGQALTYAIVSAPAHGALTGEGPNLTYTPAPGYVGPDSFTFKASDGELESAPATVTLEVRFVNHAPLALPGSFTLVQDTTARVGLTATDPDGQALSYTILSGPAHGSLGGDAPDLTYTPAAGYVGTDSFTFKVSDGSLESTGTILLTVAPLPLAPSVQSVGTLASQPFSGALSVRGGLAPFTFRITAQPTQGSLVMSGDGSFTYTPTQGATGTDFFLWEASDAWGQTASGRLDVRFTTLNQDSDTAVLDGADILAMVRSLNTDAPAFDLNGDGRANDQDLALLIAELKR
jgi:hypothetical protein